MTKMGGYGMQLVLFGLHLKCFKFFRDIEKKNCSWHATCGDPLGNVSEDLFNVHGISNPLKKDLHGVRRYWQVSDKFIRS
jgi:hypothetical protein